MDGFINVYKEQGETSHQIVSKVRRILNMRKVGHTGTLDPLATGVLPVCVGKATRAAEFLLEGTKTYLATFILGLETDTQDTTGTVLHEAPVLDGIGVGQIEAAISGFNGEIEQVPPMYSAIKKNGKKLYELARKGIEVEREPRRITIYHAQLCGKSDTYPNGYIMRVQCSKGTYIRTLCADVGRALGTGAVMAQLCREKSGIFTSDNAITIGQLEQLAAENRLDEAIQPIDGIFLQYPVLTLDAVQSKMVRNGLTLTLGRVENSAACDGRVRIYDEEGKFLMLADADHETDALSMIKGFY